MSHVVFHLQDPKSLKEYKLFFRWPQEEIMAAYEVIDNHYYRISLKSYLWTEMKIIGIEVDCHHGPQASFPEMIRYWTQWANKQKISDPLLVNEDFYALVSKVRFST